MSGNDRDDDKGGFPTDVFRKMQEGHDMFMQELHEDSQRLQQDLQQDNKPSRSGSNFFVSFKDFVDTNLNSLADSFRSLPNNIAELRAKMEAERERRKADELAVWRRWTGLEDSPDHCAMMGERAGDEVRSEAVNATLMLLREAYRRNAHVDDAKIQKLYHDPAAFGLDAFAAPMLSPGGACYYQSDSGYNAPSTAIFRLDSRDYRWLSVDWFKRSPYSPITLEDHELFGEGLTPHWRAAFEDLINATLDKPMNSEERVGRRPQGKTQSTWSGPGLDWMLSLQCRGILPPQLPTLHNKAYFKAIPSLAQQLQDGTVMRFSDAQQLADEIATPAAPSGVQFDNEPGYVEQDLYEEFDNMNAKQHAAETKNKALVDYQTQLMLLEQQNQQRLLVARQEQQEKEPAATAAATDPPPPTEPGAAWRLYEELDDAEIALYDAVQQGDGKAAIQRLSDWHRIHGIIADVTGMPANEVSEDIEVLMDQLEGLEQQREALSLSGPGSLPSQTDRSSRPAQQEQVAQQPIQKVDVLSSLTTTRTIRHADGTTTTTVTLKQKFADGREESEEKVHTYQEPSHGRHQPEQTLEKPKNKGWFWS